MHPNNPPEPYDPGQTYQSYPVTPPPAPAPKKANRLVIGLVAGAAVLLGGIAIASAAASPDTETSAGVDRPAVEPVDQREIERPAGGCGDNCGPESEPAPEPAPAEPDLTVSQEQAIGTAEDYLDYTAFSRSGLIDQLEYEDFSTEDAEFAVDYLDVSWREQAAAMAQEYLDYSHFSRQGLIEQLEYEGFTREQAEYGVDEVGL